MMRQREESSRKRGPLKDIRNLKTKPHVHGISILPCIIKREAFLGVWYVIRQYFTTCYIGISFYQTLDGSSLLSSIAERLNERGEGVVVRGGPARLSKEDRQVHLEHDDAKHLLDNAIARYKEEHKTFPARLVIHKTSSFSSDEKRGFLQATTDHHIEMVDLVSITQASTRLFRVGNYPPLRGTFLSLDDTRHILYTRGSVDFFATYPGMYVPRPLLFRCEYTEQTPLFIAQEIMALTKMNWNNTQFDGAQPITIRAARQVGSILKYITSNDYYAPNYMFYM